MQAGNDFLPNIPSLEIYGRPSGLDVLLRTYKNLLPALGGPITNGSVINPDRLKRILTKLAEDEEDAFQRLAVSQQHGPHMFTPPAGLTDMLPVLPKLCLQVAECALEQRNQAMTVCAAGLQRSGVMFCLCCGNACITLRVCC